MFAGELETGSSQQEEGIRKQHRRVEHGHCGRVDAHRKKAGSEIGVYGPQEGRVVCLIGRLVPFPLGGIGRGRQPGVRWGAVIAAQM